MGANKSWVEYVVRNRDVSINSSKPDYDVVIGKVADADTQKFIDSYIEKGDTSDAAKEKLIRQLRPGNLIDQYCFKTSRAVDILNTYGNMMCKEVK